jgi:hypothetical protein
MPWVEVQKSKNRFAWGNLDRTLVDENAPPRTKEQRTFGFSDACKVTSFEKSVQRVSSFVLGARFFQFD